MRAATEVPTVPDLTTKDLGVLGVLGSADSAGLTCVKMRDEDASLEILKRGAESCRGTDETYVRAGLSALGSFARHGEVGV